MSEQQCPTCGGAVEVWDKTEIAGSKRYIPVGHAVYVEVLAENVRLQAQVEETEAHGCQDCAYEVGVPVPGPTGLCPKHADVQIDGHNSERRRRVKAEALAERRKDALPTSSLLREAADWITTRTVGKPWLAELLLDYAVQGDACAAIEEEGL